MTENITLTGSLYIPVTSETELRAALADDTADVIRLTKDIDISSSLTVLRKVTLDLNGYVLKMTGSGSVIILDNKSGITGDLTLIDSNPTAEHKFKVNGAEPWVLDNSGTETVYGGIITGGTGSRIFFSNGVSGGGVIIGSGALTMNGGNIVGCIANTISSAP
ncbi:repeat TIGR02543 family [Anaerotruncus sp. CAG:528]|nr:repeat TIGR02543 family [Anaerotruncus sp. CAG:528]